MLCILYSNFKQNLGDEGVIHGVNQTEVEVIVTSQELLGKFPTILNSCPRVKQIIFMEDPHNKIDMAEFPRNIKIHPFSEVVEMGRNSNKGYNPPKEDDIAIIMFTSGSTGY